MSTRTIKLLTAAFVTACLFATGINAQRQMEKLGRGVIAIKQADGQVYVGWRMLGTDSDDIAFSLYRATDEGKAVRLNSQPITTATSFVDAKVDAAKSNSYFVRPILKGKEQEASASFTLPANSPAGNTSPSSQNSLRLYPE